MRIKSSTSFPHPILCQDTGDYGSKVFQINLEMQEDPESGHAVLEGSMMLDDQSIQELLESGHALSGLMITCLDTYLDRFQPCALGNVHIDLSGGIVRGPIYIRGTVVASKNDSPLNSKWIDSEFPRQARVVHSGDLLALTDELRFEAGLDKLAPLESIFHLKLHEDVPEGVFKVDLESESIDILVAPKLHSFLSLLREQEMKETLLSALFLPAVMAVLDAMREDDAHTDKRWHSVMTARCGAEGIDLRHDDIVDASQKLLDSPLGSLKRIFEKVST
ncbi:MAG: hypothetical protein ACREP4_12270 [Stenotrophomonas sp.]|uniref:hypothetical protein n=1 Tax=Stenotrophomonas sp. TaxID=69392 RepID=UPI003D6C8254